MTLDIDFIKRFRVVQLDVNPHKTNIIIRCKNHVYIIFFIFNNIIINFCLRKKNYFAINIMLFRLDFCLAIIRRFKSFFELTKDNLVTETNRFFSRGPRHSTYSCHWRQPGWPAQVKPWWLPMLGPKLPQIITIGPPRCFRRYINIISAS